MKTDRNKRSFAKMTSKKRKEFTPKKQAQGNSKRHRQAEIISSSDELDQSDEDEIIFVKSVEPPAGGMDCRIGSFCDRKLPCSRDLFAVKNEAFSASDCEEAVQGYDNYISREDVEEKEISGGSDFFKGNPSLPIYSRKPPNLQNILNVCVREDLPKEKIAKIRPMRVETTATFVLNQTEAGLCHPFDLEADDIPGVYVKKEQTRFYEVDEGNDELDVSSYIHVTKNADGKVVSGVTNERMGSGNWVHRKVDLSKTYAVIQKRAVHKKTLEVHKVQFVRYIIYVMPLAEYNKVCKELRLKRAYTLQKSNIFVSYYFDGGEEVPIVAAQHGNAKKKNTPVFRPVAHSMKKDIHSAVMEDNESAPRTIKQRLEKNSPFEANLADSVRDAKQVNSYSWIQTDLNFAETVQNLESEEQ